ncbi:hypothetical protein [Burkholderia arboris]|uniref:hypothetical protein n=1 Tax=Burkholderia arboris TaxID=488730 RepID=UPI0021CCA028|nr:hypothetical protein [Burkholderia arboris]
MTIARSLLWICLALVIPGVHAEQLRSDLHASVSTIDVTVKDFYGAEQTGKVAITQSLPDGDGPFPILILDECGAQSPLGTWESNRKCSPRSTNGLTGTKLHLGQSDGRSGACIRDRPMFGKTGETAGGQSPPAGREATFVGCAGRAFT